MGLAARMGFVADDVGEPAAVVVVVLLGLVVVVSFLFDDINRQSRFLGLYKFS